MIKSPRSKRSKIFNFDPKMSDLYEIIVILFRSSRVS